MKTMKKLIPALAMLLVSAVLLGTSTFAWFSMNNKVTVTGMTVKTTVNSNLLIATDTLGSTAKADESAFTTALEQTVKGILEPVSTVNGTTFFYTSNAKASGDAISDVYTQFTGAASGTPATYQDKFSEDYGVSKTDADTLITGETGAKPYVDYVFQLKAVNTGAATELRITKLELKYAGTTDASLAHRVAIFVEDITSANPAGGVGSLVGIYAPSTAANFSDAGGKNYAISAADAAPTMVTTTGNIYNGATKLADVAATSTKYYKVVVRLYLEGEDTTCKNDTFLALTNSWDLTVDVKLGTDEANVTSLTKEVTPAP